MSQRKFFRSKSMPQLGKWHKVPKRVEDLDKDLICDPISGEFICHPVFASDGRVYEARNLLEIFRTSGRSPFKMDNPIVAAFYSPTLKTLLDMLYKEGADRCENYNITPVLKEINNWIKTYNDEPIDLIAQRRLLPLPLPLPVTRPAVEEINVGVHNTNTFLHALRTWKGGARACCFTPVSFWSRRLNKPAINAAANTFILLEPLLFFFVFSLLLEDKSFSRIGLFDFGKVLLTSSALSASVAFVVGMTVVIADRIDPMDLSRFR